MYGAFPDSSLVAALATVMATGQRSPGAVSCPGREAVMGWGQRDSARRLPALSRLMPWLEPPWSCCTWSQQLPRPGHHSCLALAHTRGCGHASTALLPPAGSAACPSVPARRERCQARHGAAWGHAVGLRAAAYPGKGPPVTEVTQREATCSHQLVPAAQPSPGITDFCITPGEEGGPLAAVSGRPRSPHAQGDPRRGCWWQQSPSHAQSGMLCLQA